MFAHRIKASLLENYEFQTICMTLAAFGFGKLNGRRKSFQLIWNA